MDSHKLDISGKTIDSPKESYKPLDTDMEDEAVSRPKSLVISKASPETDGADEKMLPNNDENSIPNKESKSFSDKQNGDTKLDIGDLKSQFIGLGKEELMKYVNDPFWVRLRWVCFIGFWLLWAAMLVGAILIIYFAPKCNPPPAKTWWEKGPLTEIKPDSKPEDINIGTNIKGVIIPWTGDAYENFDESNEGMKLIQTITEKDTKVILEVEPGVSNVWFDRSEGNDPEFSDYYIWSTGKNPMTGNQPLPPNNWINPKNTSSWKYSDKRKQFYYSPFDKPHLNFRNSKVVAEFSNVIKRFISANVTGIRLRNAAFLLVDSKFEDEPVKSNTVGLDHTQYGFYVHTKTENLLELGELIRDWRKLVKNLTEDGTLMVSEELEHPEAFKVNRTLVVDLPLQSHIFSKSTLLVNETANSLNYTFNIDKLKWPLWEASTTALPKDALDMIIYVLPGAPLIDKDDVIHPGLLKLRESPSIMFGMCGIYKLQNDSVLSILRAASGSPGILVAANPTNNVATINIPSEIPFLRDLRDVTIRMFSKSYNETLFMDVNGKRDATAVPISPNSVLLLEYVPKKEEE